MKTATNQNQPLSYTPGESNLASVGVRTISAPSARRTSTFTKGVRLALYTVNSIFSL